MEDGDRSVSKKCTPLGATTIMCYVYENEMKFGQAGMGLKSLVSKNVMVWYSAWFKCS